MCQTQQGKKNRRRRGGGGVGGAGLTGGIKSCLKQELGCNCTVWQPYSAVSPARHRTKRPAVSLWPYSSSLPSTHIMGHFVSCAIRVLQVLFLSVEKLLDGALFKKGHWNFRRNMSVCLLYFVRTSGRKWIEVTLEVENVLFAIRLAGQAGGSQTADRGLAKYNPTFQGFFMLELSVHRLVGEHMRATISQITTGYYWGQQKSISECTTQSLMYFAIFTDTDQPLY